MTKLLTSIAASIALLAAGPAIAQESQQQGEAGMQSQQSAPANFDDAQLQKFVAVQEDLTSVRDEYMAKIESAGDQEEAQKLQQEANEEMVSAIEARDLTVQTYNEIATAYISNPETRERIESMM
jgi:hypothetical protein